MAYLLKMLSDMLQNPPLLSHIHICPKPKVKLGHCQKTLSFQSHRQGSRSHRDGLANSLLSIAIILVPPRYAISPAEFA